MSNRSNCIPGNASQSETAISNLGARERTGQGVLFEIRERTRQEVPPSLALRW